MHFSLYFGVKHFSDLYVTCSHITDGHDYDQYDLIKMIKVHGFNITVNAVKVPLLWGYSRMSIKGVLHPRPVFGLFLHFSQKLQHIGNK